MRRYSDVSLTVISSGAGASAMVVEVRVEVGVMCGLERVRVVDSQQPVLSETNRKVLMGTRIHRWEKESVYRNAV